MKAQRRRWFHLRKRMNFVGHAIATFSRGSIIALRDENKRQKYQVFNYEWTLVNPFCAVNTFLPTRRRANRFVLAVLIDSWSIKGELIANRIGSDVFMLRVEASYGGQIKLDVH